MFVRFILANERMRCIATQWYLLHVRQLCDCMCLWSFNVFFAFLLTSCIFFIFINLVFVIFFFFLVMKKWADCMYFTLTLCEFVLDQCVFKTTGHASGKRHRWWAIALYVTITNVLLYSSHLSISPFWQWNYGINAETTEKKTICNHITVHVSVYSCFFFRTTLREICPQIIIC